MQFFIDTRMADRRTQPDLLTPQLSIQRDVNQHSGPSKNGKRIWESSEKKIDGASLQPSARSSVNTTSNTAVFRKVKRRRVLSKTVSMALSPIPEAAKMNCGASKSWKVAGPTPGPCSVLTSHRNLQNKCPQSKPRPITVPADTAEQSNNDLGRVVRE